MGHSGLPAPHRPALQGSLTFQIRCLQPGCPLAPARAHSEAPVLPNGLPCRIEALQALNMGRDKGGAGNISAKASESSGSQSKPAKNECSLCHKPVAVTEEDHIMGERDPADRAAVLGKLETAAAACRRLAAVGPKGCGQAQLVHVLATSVSYSP